MNSKVMEKPTNDSDSSGGRDSHGFLKGKRQTHIFSMVISTEVFKVNVTSIPDYKTWNKRTGKSRKKRFPPGLHNTTGAFTVRAEPITHCAHFEVR